MRQPSSPQLVGSDPAHECRYVVSPENGVRHGEVPGGASSDGSHRMFPLTNLLDIGLKELKTIAIKLIVRKVESEHLRLDETETRFGIEVARRLKRIQEIVCIHASGLSLNAAYKPVRRFPGTN